MAFPLDQLAPGLKAEIQALLKWKQAEFAINRPKRGKIRAVSANNLRLIICQLAGYAINVCGIQPASMSELVQKTLVAGFVEWSINERGVQGRSIQPKLGILVAVMKNHPSFIFQDFNWFKPLIDNIPIEDDSERKQRKAKKYVDYEALEAIPGKIRATRESYEKKKTKNTKLIARLAMQELMMHWLLVLPWRQRNLRECRIGGPTPNLFDAKKWLKEHPKDYLTLSKMLWHNNAQTTIQIYGARYNESTGVSAMEAWRDEREAKWK